MKSRFAMAIALAFAVTQFSHASLTGNPAADGWTSQGNSLSSGVYVRGEANYGYDTYSATFTVDGAIDSAAGGGWNVGDTVIGVGGVFNNNTIGWSVTGTPVNSLLANSPGLKIQAKFGTDASVAIPWSVSTIAPGLGNGVGSLTNGGDGSLQIRTSGSNPASFWAANAGTLNQLASSSHLIATPSSPVPGTDVARLIWNVDGNGKMSSWQILLNVTLLGSLDPAPAPGSLAIMTVQNGDNTYTDALVEIPAAGGVVPEPATMVVWGGLALIVGGASWWQKKKALD